MGPFSPSSYSILGPEVEQNHLAAIVAQFEMDAVLIVTLDLGSRLADDKMAELI